MATTALAERAGGTRVLKEADPPDQHYLDALKSVLESVYEEQDQQIEDLRRNRDLADPPAIPEWMNVVDTRVQDPTVRDEIARVVATLTMRFPTCAVTPGEPGSDLGQEYSTELEHFLEELFKVCSYRVAGHGTQEALTDACVGDGGGWVKWVVDWHRWEPVFQKGRDAEADDEEVEDEKKRRGPPLARIALDPATIYPVWEADRLTEVLEVSHRQTYPLLREYDLTIEEDGSFGERLGRPLSEEEAQRYPHEIEFCEWWSPDFVCYWLHSGKGSHLLKTIRHGYGQVPYFFAPGLLHNYMNDRKVGLSVASNKLELTRFRSFLITSMVQYAAMQAAAPYFKKSAVPAEAMDGEDRDPNQIPSFEIPYASVISAGSEDDMTLMEHPGIPEGLPQVLGIITSLQQGVDTPKPGPAVGGDLAGAGFAIQSILAEAKTRHHPFVSSIERCMEQEAYFVLHLIQNVIQETVWVRRSLAPGQVAAPAAQWIGMGPEDTADAVGIRWTLDPEPATSKIVEARYVIEMIQAGLMSIDEGAAYLGRNPDELREGRSMDRMRNEPWYTKFFDERLLRKLNRADILKQAALASAQSGLLPGADPMMMNMASQARGGGMLGGGFGPPMAPGPGGAPPGTGPMMMDQGALAAAPGGGPAIPQPGPAYGLIGANMGQPAGVPLPTAAINAGTMNIGPG